MCACVFGKEREKTGKGDSSMSDLKRGNVTDDTANPEHVIQGPSSKMSNVPPIIPPAGVAKHWAKKYRTEIAASSSSVLSTFVAVSHDI